MKSLLQNQRGQSLSEYALILVLIMAVLALTLPNVATAISNALDLSAALPDAG